MDGALRAPIWVVAAAALAAETVRLRIPRPYPPVGSYSAIL